MEAYGPYDMAHGESVRLVYLRGFAGLNLDAAMEIGRAYRRSNFDDNAPITYEVGGLPYTMTKNEWVIRAGADSLFKMFALAKENFEGGGYATIPEPPRPAQRLEVTSGTDKITLAWEPYTGHQPPGGWEIYRAQNRYYGIPLPDEASSYQLVATANPSATSFDDTDVERGVSYYYYMQAVDQNGLRSSRYFNQTYDPAFLVRPPGSSLADVRIVPNPYNLSSEADVRYPDIQNRLGFLETPGNATIQIYTELGELVETIEHSSGSGDIYWDLTTSSTQLVVSGLYIAYIRDNDTGEHVLKKFVIIR
jgi:hypothetical protein